MAEIERKSFFKKLNSVGYKCFEAATVAAKMAGNPYIEIPHLINQALTLQDSDIHHILTAFAINPARLASDLQTAMTKIPRGGGAYVDFSGRPSLAAEIPTHPNLVVLRTLSKAFGLAGARVGTTIADPAVIAILQKVIAPYPVPAPVLTAALAALEPAGLAAARDSVAAIVAERARLTAALPGLPVVRQVWPSDTNYLLLEVADAARVMAAGRAAGVIWRDRSRDVPNTVRITVGSAAENDTTLEVLARV